MSMTDPVADMLTRIRNACSAGHRRVDVPASKLKVELARLLLENHYIAECKVLEDGGRGVRVGDGVGAAVSVSMPTVRFDESRLVDVVSALALTARAPAKLMVDASRLVTFGREDVQAAQGDHALAFAGV